MLLHLAVLPSIEFTTHHVCTPCIPCSHLSVMLSCVGVSIPQACAPSPVLHVAPLRLVYVEPVKGWSMPPCAGPHSLFHAPQRVAVAPCNDQQESNGRQGNCRADEHPVPAAPVMCRLGGADCTIPQPWKGQAVPRCHEHAKPDAVTSVPCAVDAVRALGTGLRPSA